MLRQHCDICDAVIKEPCDNFEGYLAAPGKMATDSHQLRMTIHFLELGSLCPPVGVQLCQGCTHTFLTTRILPAIRQL